MKTNRRKTRKSKAAGRRKIIVAALALIALALGALWLNRPETLPIRLPQADAIVVTSPWPQNGDRCLVISDPAEISGFVSAAEWKNRYLEDGLWDSARAWLTLVKDGAWADEAYAVLPIRLPYNLSFSRLTWRYGGRLRDGKHYFYRFLAPDDFSRADFLAAFSGDGWYPFTRDFRTLQLAAPHPLSEEELSAFMSDWGLSPAR